MPSLRRWMVFISSLQDMEGDNKLVNIVDDWESFTVYAQGKQGFYQLLAKDGKFEVRVQTGRLAFKRVFESGQDELMAAILDFCKSHHYIQVTESVRSEKFFK